MISKWKVYMGLLMISFGCSQIDYDYELHGQGVSDLNLTTEIEITTSLSGAQDNSRDILMRNNPNIRNTKWYCNKKFIAAAVIFFITVGGTLLAVLRPWEENTNDTSKDSELHCPDRSRNLLCSNASLPTPFWFANDRCPDGTWVQCDGTMPVSCKPRAFSQYVDVLGHHLLNVVKYGSPQELCEQLLRYLDYKVTNYQDPTQLNTALMQCAKNGSVDKAKTLLAYGANPILLDMAKLTARDWAFLSGYLDRFDSFLPLLANPSDDISPVDCANVLHGHSSSSQSSEQIGWFMAAKKGNLVSLCNLLSHGQYVNETDNSEVDAVTWASVNKQARSVRLLCQSDAYMDHISVKKQTPLMIASDRGYTPVVHVLLLCQANPNYAEPLNGDTAGIIATRNKHEDIVRLLLQNNKLDINQANKQGNTIGMETIRTGNNDLLSEILRRPDIKVNQPNLEDDTMCILAARLNQTNSLRMLLNSTKYVDVNTKNIHSYTALMEAAIHNNPSCITLLLDNYADVDAIDNLGNPPWLLSAQYGSLDSFKVLMNYLGENKEIGKILLKTNGIGNNVGMVAAQYGKRNIIEYILRRYRDVPMLYKTVNHYGNNMLMLAAFGGLPDIMEVIASNVITKCNDNLLTRNAGGNNVLQLSTVSGCVQCARLLMLYSAPGFFNTTYSPLFNNRNYNNKTAYMMSTGAMSNLLLPPQQSCIINASTYCSQTRRLVAEYPIEKIKSTTKLRRLVNTKCTIYPYTPVSPPSYLASNGKVDAYTTVSPCSVYLNNWPTAYDTNRLRCSDYNVCFVYKKANGGDAVLLDERPHDMDILFGEAAVYDCDIGVRAFIDNRHIKDNVRYKFSFKLLLGNDENWGTDKGSWKPVDPWFYNGEPDTIFPNERFDPEATPLMAMMQYGKCDAVHKILAIDLKHRVDMRDSSGFGPLYYGLRHKCNPVCISHILKVSEKELTEIYPPESTEKYYPYDMGNGNGRYPLQLAVERYLYYLKYGDTGNADAYEKAITDSLLPYTPENKLEMVINHPGPEGPALWQVAGFSSPMVETLMRYGADPFKEHNLNNAFTRAIKVIKETRILAAQWRAVASLKTMLQKDFEPIFISNGYTLVDAATVHTESLLKQVLSIKSKFDGYKELICRLLNHKSSGELVNQRDGTGDTALHTAINNGDLIAVELIINDNKYLPSIRNNGDKTALDLVMEAGDESMLKIFRNSTAAKSSGDHGLYWNLKDPLGENALFKAVRNGKENIITLAIQYNLFNVASQNKDGDTILHVSAALSQDDIVDSLLKNIPSNTVFNMVNIQNSEGKTPLHIAAEKYQVAAEQYQRTKDTKIIIDLIEHRARLDILDKNGIPPIALLVRKEVFSKELFCLIQGYLPDIIPTFNHNQDNLVSIAIRENLPDLLDILIQKYGIEKCNGLTPGEILPISLSIKQDQYTMTCRLLDYRRLNTLRDGHDRTVLMYAAKSPDSRYLRKILLRDILELHHRDRDGYTALMYSVQNQLADNVALLLQYMDEELLNLKDEQGHDVRWWADLVGNRDILQLLNQKHENVNNCIR